jgi:hypothetical protein
MFHQFKAPITIRYFLAIFVICSRNGILKVKQARYLPMGESRLQRQRHASFVSAISWIVGCQECFAKTSNRTGPWDCYQWCQSKGGTSTFKAATVRFLSSTLLRLPPSPTGQSLISVSCFRRLVLRRLSFPCSTTCCHR